MLAFEMDICTDFVSYKLFSVLNEPTTLAVVMGGADYSKLLPPMSYIDVADFKSAKDLANYILYLDAHNGKYRWSYKFSPSDFFYNFCKKLLITIKSVLWRLWIQCWTYIHNMSLDDMLCVE